MDLLSLNSLSIQYLYFKDNDAFNDWTPCKGNAFNDWAPRIGNFVEDKFNFWFPVIGKGWIP